MPGNLPASSGSGDGSSLTESQGTGRGRKRYCKKCKFTCTDAREFTAHQAAHSESDDNRAESATVFSQVTKTSSHTLQTRRVLRPKRTLTGSLPDSDTSLSAMEVPKDIMVETASVRDGKAADFKPYGKDLASFVADTVKSEEKTAKSTQNSETKSPSLSGDVEEECMDADEGEDEPDAMSTSLEESLHVERGDSSDGVRRLPHDIADKFSADEEVDDEDRLVIDDDDALIRNAHGIGAQPRLYTCQHCRVTTGSAKAYLHHLKENHNTEVNIFDCDLCDYATVYKQRLNKHRKLHFLTESGDGLNAAFDSTDKSGVIKIEENNRYSKFSLPVSSAVCSPYKTEKTDDMDDEEDDDISLVDQKSTSIAITPENIDQVLDEDKKKKKKTRQEVDPGKYFEAVDSSGTKYACSQCGNIYKWRKSLNKHWKEKHSMDPLVEVASPPGMLELLKSGKYTQLGARRIYDKTFLATIKTNKSDNLSHITSPHVLTQSPSPPHFFSAASNLVSSASRMAASVNSLLPKMIGPFVSSTAQPVFPGMPLALSHLSMQSNGYDSSEEAALDLTRDSKSSSRNSPYVSVSTQDQNKLYDQDQPLDFSKNNKAAESVAAEKPWEGMSSMKPAHSINQLIPRLHHCSKCDFTSTSEVEFANHTSSHLNKRIVKCFECKLQFNSMDELNNHFIKLHFRKLTDYKEAIKKIPHGLQQTYHLLNMEIHDIGELGNQDLGAGEGKSLKCKKCDFEAKWPAELQKHAVSHSEERPYICMVCGSTYKWKWDLVKHFQKSHPNLPNPYRRNDKKDSPDGSSDDEEDEPVPKRVKLEPGSGMLNGNVFGRDDNISVEGIIAATQAGQRLISSQPNILDDEPNVERNLCFLNPFSYTSGEDMTQVAQMVQAAQAAQEIDRRNKAQKAIQDAVRNRQNSNSSGSNSSTTKKSVASEPALSPSPGSCKSEELPYKCTMCNYHARWPSEVTQHMKNHSDSKPYLCPRCEYRSKWKWDVVKHLKRCGGGGINDVIDTTKGKKRDASVSNGPPNVVVSQQGKVKKMTPQPSLAYMFPSGNDSGQQAGIMVTSEQNSVSDESSGEDFSRPGSCASPQDLSNSNNSNNDNNSMEHNNNNYTGYTNGLPFTNLNTQAMTSAPPHVSSLSYSSSPAQSPSLPQTTHTSSTRQSETWNCPHCPFTTQSQAELKRHSGLHSDDKPFKCDVCQYSTRWACDLKKHRKSYNHFPRPAVQKEEKEKTSQVRFRCTQCNIFFHTLQSLLEHRQAEHTGQESSHSSPAPSTEIEMDMARIKHPRKQVKKIECTKCEFVCKSRQTIEKHMEEHEQLEQTGIQCFYCRSLFKDKESLLDHISTHSAFNPKEWETFFMITDEDHNQLKDDTKAQAKKDYKLQKSNTDKNEMSQGIAQVNKKCSENEKPATDSTEARIQQILSEVPKQMIISQQGQGFNKFKCEWCPAEFVNLTAVYKHAIQAHPIQLKEQDVSMALSGHANHAGLPAGQKLQPKKMYTGEPIDILKQQIAEKRNHQLGEKHDAVSSSKVQEAVSKKDDEGRGGKRYSCGKCSFSSANPETFQRHQELHGSKLNSQCWFCDYSVDKMNLLYQHMKISHTRKWKALSQDPKYASQIHRMNLAFANSSNAGNNNDSPPEISSQSDFSIMDLSSKNKTSRSEDSHDIMYLTKQQHTWSGIPVNIVPVGNVLNYVCPHCAFHSASIGETCEHVVRSHRAMSKFSCKTCQFSDDNIHVMSDHCKKEHSKHERIVEVVDFKQINYSELQIVQLNALREQMAHDPSKKSDMNTDAKTLATKAMSCPFCPFKTLMTEHMKTHISSHSKQARFGCQFCDFSSEVPTAISEHIKVHDVNYIMDYRSFLENVKMSAHVKKEPVDRRFHELDSKPTAKFLEHSELTHSDQEGSPRSKANKRIRYRCSECPYHTTCKSNMVKHVRQHNNNKKYKCTKCSYGAARAVLLKNHLDSHDAPTEADGQFHDIFCDPSSPNETFKNVGSDDVDSEETEMEAEDFDEDEEDDPHSDDSDEANVKAIVDLEAKDILEAEAAHRASFYSDEGDSADKQSRKQKCQHCPFSSNSGYEFRKHLNFHGTQERYKCDHCSYSLDRLNLLSQHRRLHAEEPGYNPNPPAADLLNTDFILLQNSDMADTEQQTEFGNLEEGKNILAPVCLFSCVNCPYKTTKKKLFDIHCNSHNLRKRYICDYCDWSADHIGHLYQHRRVHEHEPDFNISPDEKVFLNQEFGDGASGEFEAKLMEIKNIDKPVEEGETETPPFKLTVVKKSYPCKLCPYKTNSKNSYSVHESMHKSDAEFACTECSYSSENKGLLKQHLRLHATTSTRTSSPLSALVKGQHPQQPSDMETPCSQYDPNVNKKKESQRTVNHLESQSAPEIKCQRCPFTASSQNALQEHMRCHTAQDSLTCPFCDFSATSGQVMYPHIQIHFPGTKLEPEALECMLEEHTRITNNNIHIHDSVSKSLSPPAEKTLSLKEKETTAMKRVYVCQFCEREFEAKHLMIQHEKQHLVGSHAEDKCD
ncbi:unnamed protein product [Candidula unifasciata]|uniref:C2H2-type domain-containing protein n=1 Tax=Candidula unifasciata TaxID=100452 RepID=A0A8S3YJ40_9EUPU|nr:unnamed protein product [Candidula unifasciata]